MKKQAVFKRTLPLLLAVLFCLSASGCWQDSADPGDLSDLTVSSAEEPETPAVSLPEEFALPYLPDQSLDPISCPDGIQQTVCSLLYEGLFELDTRLQPQNRLCASAAYDAAALTWTLQLRSGVSFSDGTPLTGEDAAKSLQRAMTSDRYRSRLSGIQSVSASGSTVTILLSSPNSQLPALLDIPIVKAGSEAAACPIGTGPYALSYREDHSLFLTKNSHWWGGSGQPVEEIALVKCDSNDAGRYQFTSHAVQLITNDLTGVSPLSATGSFEFYDADTTILQYIGFNIHHSIFSNAAARSAVGLGIDRATVVSAYLSGHALAAQFPISPVSPEYPSELEQTYSSAAFEAAMTDAGLNTGAVRKVTLLVNSDNSFKVSIARYLASALSAYDLQVEVNALPWEEYCSALTSGRFDLYYGETRLTADWNLTALLGSTGGLNYGHYADPMTDQLLLSFSSATDRASAAKALCSYLRQQSPILPICFKRISVLTQEHVIEQLSPTASNPFYQLSSCTIHLSDTAS